MKNLKTCIGTLAAGLLLAVGVSHAAINERNFKLALVVDKGTAQYDGVEKFASLVKEKSGGKMNVKLFPGGTLGGDLQVLSSLQGGTIEMTLTNASLLQGLSKPLAVYDLPFLFNTAKEADAIVDGPIGQKLLAPLPEKGVVGLAYWELGFRQVHNSKHPINKVEDFAGLKIRVIQTPLYIDFMNAMGANAVPLPFPEVYTALETKTVDGATNPTITMVVQKFYEVQKYLSLTNHMYNPQLLTISKKTWDKLNDEEKKVIQDAANEARDYQRQVSRKKAAESLEELKKHVTVNDVAPAEIARMRAKAQPVIDKYSKEVGEDLVKEINVALEKMRAAK